MSANSSSSDMIYCTKSDGGRVITTLFTAIHTILYAPLSIFVLYVGYQRWRQQRSFATTSHSDIFAYHSVVQQLIFTLGNVLVLFNLYFDVSEMFTPEFIMTSGYLPSLMLFHVLTCVERYLAVVHPIIYLGLRQSGGVRIRNISIACMWLQSSAWIGVCHAYSTTVSIPSYIILYFFYLVGSLLIISFCSISVLCVLIRPGPGNVSGDGQRVDQSKRRAFNTITAILAVLWLFLVPCIVNLAIENSKELSDSDGCLTLMSFFGFGLPFSLVLPLLFMQRSRKMLSCPC